MTASRPSLALPYALAGKRVWVAGHLGMVGGAVIRRLRPEQCDLLTADRRAVDLKEQAAVRAWMQREKPEVVIIAAAKVGGILANDTYPVDFLYDNMMISAHIIESAHRCGVERLLYLGSSCIYPKFAPQPIAEDSLLTGTLEPTNEWYAVAKIAGIKLTQAFRRQYGRHYVAAMPTNLYGPGDKYDLQTSHVVPALIRKAHEAKLRGDKGLVIWGTGTPRREFLHVDDCADAIVHVLKNYDHAEHINIGSGEDLTIRDLAGVVCDVVGYKGAIVCDTTKPDGTPRKLMSGAKLKALGWRPRIGLRDGLATAYADFLARGIS